MAKLRTHNNEFRIAKEIEKAPAGVMHRELSRNPIEADRDDEHDEQRRVIRYYRDENNKVIILNSGRGMDEDELRLATDIGWSSKHQGLTGRDNWGEGAKVSSLRYNRNGMRYRSRKNGVILEALIWQNGDGVWERVDQEIDGEIVDIWEPRITDEDAARYARDIPNGGDFTEVKLYGNYDEHNTAHDPYDTGTSPKETIPYEIFGRYYRFPRERHGLEVDLKFDKNFGARGGNWGTSFLTIEQLMVRYPEAFGHLDHSERTVVDAQGREIIIKYVFTKPIGGGENNEKKGRHVWWQHSQGPNSGRCAIVFMDEMYEVIEQAEWKRESPYYLGLNSATDFSVFIILPDEYPVSDDGSRKRLMYQDGPRSGDYVDMRKDFLPLIVANKPGWVDEILKKRNAGRKESKSVEAKLAKLAQELWSKDGPKPKEVPVYAYELGGKRDIPEMHSPIDERGELEGGSPAHSTHAHPGKKVANDDTNDDKFDEVTSKRRQRNGPNQGYGTGGLSRLGYKRKKVGVREIEPAGRPQRKRTYPKMEWLVTDEELASFEEIVGRGAIYIQMQNTCYLNRQYPAVQDVVNRLIEKVRSSGRVVPDEAVLEFINRAAEDYIAYQVGTAILLAERAGSQYSVDRNTVEAMFDNEALTSVMNMACFNESTIYTQFHQDPDFTGLFGRANALAANPRLAETEVEDPEETETVVAA